MRWLGRHLRAAPTPPPSMADPALVNYVRDVAANPPLPPTGDRWCSWCERAYDGPDACPCCAGRVNTCAHTQVEAEPVLAAGGTLAAAAAAFEAALVAALPPGPTRHAAMEYARAAYHLAAAPVSLPPTVEVPCP